MKNRFSYAVDILLVVIGILWMANGDVKYGLFAVGVGMVSFFVPLWTFVFLGLWFMGNAVSLFVNTEFLRGNVIFIIAAMMFSYGLERALKRP